MNKIFKVVLKLFFSFVYFLFYFIILGNIFYFIFDDEVISQWLK